MSLASKTYVIANGNPNDGAQVEQNYLDLINFMNGSMPHSDGTGGPADIRGLVASQVGDQSKKFHVGTSSTVNTDASGYATVTHGAGFTPILVLCTWAGQNLGGLNGSVMGTDTYTATTFRLRVTDVSAHSSLDFKWLCIG